MPVPPVIPDPSDQRSPALPSAVPVPSVLGVPSVLRVLAVLAVLAVLVRAVVAAGDPTQGGWRLLAAIAGCWAVFAIGVWAVLRTPVRLAVPLIVAGGVALQLVAISSPPRLTDDFYRYAWDGRVQTAGISPYRYPPTDPALAGLRTDWLFPSGRTRINHPTSPTIYPPVAQAEFAAVNLLTRPLGPDGGGARTWQVLAAALATATTLALLRALRGSDPRRAVLWAWCPTVVIECGGNAHVDALAALLAVLALTASARGRLLRAGVMVGLAIGTKLLPGLLLPALLAPLPSLRGRLRGGLRGGLAGWRRWTTTRGVLLLGAVVALVVGYLPHVLAVGSRVLGFLPGYLPEEGYDGSSRFPLLRPWLPDRVAVVVGLAVIVATAAAVARRGDPRRPWTGAMVTTGVAFAVLGITYPWYALLLVPLVALDGRGSWLAIAAAAYPAYLAPALGLPFTATSRVAYAVALAVILASLRHIASPWTPTRSEIHGRLGCASEQARSRR